MHNDIINLLQIGFDAHQSGNLDRAAEFYRKVLLDAPDNADALHLLGVVHLQQEDIAGAVSKIKQSIRENPRNPEALNHLATALQGLGKYDDAVLALESAISLEPNFTEAWCNLGDARDSLGDLIGAIDAYQKSINIAPESATPYVNVSNTYLKNKQYEEALSMVEHVLGIDPELAPAWLNKGNALRGLKRPKEAIKAYSKALETDCNRSAIHCLIADCFHDLGCNLEALTHFEKAHRLDPKDVDPLIGIAFCQIRNKHLKVAESALIDVLAMEPQNCRALAYYTILLQLDERTDELNVFADFDRDVFEFTFPVPENYKNLGIFNQKLCAALQKDKSLVSEPPDKTTRGGSQSGELTSQRDPEITAFHDTLKKVLNDFLRDIKPQNEHPHYGSIPSDYRIQSWSTILDAEGHQLSHLHPTGWLSGVYYAQVPPELSKNDPKNRGWLEFGGSGYDLPAHNGPVKLVAPTEGGLVLFPSYFLHRTIPFQSKTQRISIAFDLIPYQQSVNAS